MKVAIKGFIHLRQYEWDAAPTYQHCVCDMSDVGPEYVMVMPHDFEVEIPDDFDPLPRQIGAMRAKQKDILATAQAQVTNIEEQIQRLLCLEHKTEVA